MQEIEIAAAPIPRAPSEGAQRGLPWYHTGVWCVCVKVYILVYFLFHFKTPQEIANQVYIWLKLCMALLLGQSGVCMACRCAGSHGDWGGWNNVPHDQVHVTGYVIQRYIVFVFWSPAAKAQTEKKCLFLNHATQVSFGQMVWFPWVCGSILDGFTCGSFQGTHWHLEWSELKLHFLDALWRWNAWD